VQYVTGRPVFTHGPPGPGPRAANFQGRHIKKICDSQVFIKHVLSHLLQQNYWIIHTFRENICYSELCEASWPRYCGMWSRVVWFADNYKLVWGNQLQGRTVDRAGTIVKGKVIPFQAWTGPEGSMRLRLPDFKTLATWMW